MVYSTILGHISVLNHHQLPSVSIWSTHTENKSRDITSICWNFLWTCPVYFALQIDRRKTGSEEHNLMRFNLSSHQHSAAHSMSVWAPGSYLLKQKWAPEPQWVHSLALILLLPHNSVRVQQEESSLKEDQWRPYLHLFTILSKPRDRPMASAVPAHLWVIGHPPPWPGHQYLSNLLKSGHDFPEKEKSFLSWSVYLHHSQHSWISQQCLSSICNTIAIAGKNQILSFRAQWQRR